MHTLQVKPIGTIRVNEDGIFIEVDTQYVPALKALEGFSHLNIIWWFSDFDTEEMRNIHEVPKPYKKSPDTMGIFATRSPVRPNPIALSTVQVIGIDYKKGIIRIPYIDANDRSPLLDIKPYTPSLDRIEKPNVPDWCKHWPISAEKSANFDWSNEFNF